MANGLEFMGLCCVTFCAYFYKAWYLGMNRRGEISGIKILKRVSFLDKQSKNFLHTCKANGAATIDVCTNDAHSLIFQLSIVLCAWWYVHRSIHPLQQGSIECKMVFDCVGKGLLFHDFNINFAIPLSPNPPKVSHFVNIFK